jgi:hypothetical protein
MEEKQPNRISPERATDIETEEVAVSDQTSENTTRDLWPLKLV